MAKYIRGILFLLISFFIFLPLPGSAPLAGADTPGLPLEITSISPVGEDVPGGKKIVFQFNRAVVPVGRMDRKSDEIPVSITPHVKGSWRWLNTSALAYILDDDSPLKPATKYKITVKPGIKAEDGVTTEKRVEHSFITKRPSVVHTWFRTWQSPSLPVVRITFDQPVSRSSVEKHIFVKVIGEEESRINVKAEPDERDRDVPLFLPLPGENITLINSKGDKKPEKTGKISLWGRLFRAIGRIFTGKDEPYTPGDSDRGDPVYSKFGRESRRVWLISPEKELPLNIAASFRVEPGLESFFGPERGTEKRELSVFNTFPEFRFSGIQCYDNSRSRVFIGNEYTGNNKSLCNPSMPVSLVFSSPVINSEIKRYIEFDPSISEGEEGYDPWKNINDYTRLNSPYPGNGNFYVYLPQVFKADRTYHLTCDPELRDEFGRRLMKPIDIIFTTDHRPPGFHLPNSISVLEKDADTDMPVVVTNLDKLTLSYSRLTSDEKNYQLFRELPLPEVRDVPVRIPMGIRKMLNAGSGIISGTFTTSPNISRYRDASFFFAEVTPFQVHAKMGHFNTLVWVTDLKTGEPVKDARVSIHKGTYKSLNGDSETYAQGTTDSEGIVILQGSERLNRHIRYEYGRFRDRPFLFAKVEKAGDFALLPMDYNFTMSTYDASHNTVSSYMRREYGHIRSWGTTSQGVYRAGDRIEYKVYVRNQDKDGLIPAPQGKYHLKVVDPMNKTVHEVRDVVLSKFGAINGEFNVPETGAVGWYRFILTSSYTGINWYPMNVLVSDFAPAPFNVATEINGKVFLPGDRLDITTEARLHGGGPYTGASARITVSLRNMPLFSENPLTRGFFFNSYNPDVKAVQTLFKKDDSVDDNGNLVTSLDIPESGIYFGRLEVESSVRDDRGKYISGRAFARYGSRDRFVGIRSETWVFTEKETASVEVIAVDRNGSPVPDETVLVKIEHQETKAARVKGAGNAYLTKLNTEWVEDESREIKTGKGPVKFEFVPQKTGNIRISASVKDSKGRGHFTQVLKWVEGRGTVVWDDDHRNGLEIIPEKDDFKVGETARYMVKNPYPGAKALVTIERYGTIKQWVQTLETATPFIEFEIEKDFIPGFYLSVIVMSPRIESAPLKDSVDLGKPAFRMGYVKVSVSDPCKKIVTEIKTDKDIYKPGEKVRVNLKASFRDKNSHEPVEFAVAVLDEAVLDLLKSGKSYFDPYKGFYNLESLDVVNYSLLMKLVGRQKFETKGADPAGDGGGDPGLRTLFKFLSYWNPSIEADSNGNAGFEFKLPENLTGWRILVMAVTPGDMMGLSEGSVKVNRPTEIRPVMPNQVTEGDSFKAGFSIMNRTDTERNIDFTITAMEAVETRGENGPEKLTGALRLKPYERTTVWLPVKTRGTGRIYFTARGGDKLDRDGTVYELDVRKMASLETSATYGSADKGLISESLEFPKEIRTDMGSVFVNLSPTVIGNLEGAFKYLRDYPYTCWEQKITRAVMASHFVRLKKYIPDLDWEDAPEIPDSLLELAANYQAPNGGMAYYVPENRYVSPYLSAYTALAFTWLRERGHNVPAPVENRLQGYLEEMLRKNTAPDFYTRGMASTVRAVALAALAKNSKITFDDLNRYYPHVKEMDTFGKAHFLLAAAHVSGTEDMRKEAFNMILSQADQTGGKFIVNDTFDDGYSRILTSALRTNAAVLSAFMAYGSSDEEGKRLTGLIPDKMVRYITQTRKQSGRWENTQENIFCMNAIAEYSSRYGSIDPDMNIAASVDEDTLGNAVFSEMTDKPVILKRSIKNEDSGKHRQVRLVKDGPGRFYYSVGMTYAPKDMKIDNINAGIEIRREYSAERDGKWTLLKNPMKIKRGELVRVDLYVSVPSARNFVAVEDPVPGGLEPVNRDLATASVVDAEKAKSDYAADSWFFHYGEWSYYGINRWSFYHKELRHHAAVFYSEWLPPGNYHLSYTAQAIASGDFTVMPAHAEEMYNPDVFGKSAPAVLKVKMEKQPAE